MGSIRSIWRFIFVVSISATYDSDDLNEHFQSEHQYVDVTSTNVACLPDLLPPVELVRYDTCLSGREI